MTKLDSFGSAIAGLLSECLYPEDVRVLEHFVYHARINHCTYNYCIVCDMAVDSENRDSGHSKDCHFRVALERVSDGRETLTEYYKRK